MKVYALAILLIFAIVENTSADWRNNVKINYWNRINSSVNSSLSRITSEANAKGTPAAAQCRENARIELRSITQSGYNEVSSCVRAPSTQGEAQVCSQQVASRVFEQTLSVSRSATECINNA